MAIIYDFATRKPITAESLYEIVNRVAPSGSISCLANRISEACDEVLHGTMIARILNVLRYLFGCKHAHRTNIIRRRQYCLDCGAFRFANFGEKPSAWFKYPYERHPKADQQ